MNLRNLSAGNVFRIVAEWDRGFYFWNNIPESKRYIVYRESDLGEKDSGADTRRKTRVGRSSHGEMASGWKPSLNSNLSRGGFKNCIWADRTIAEFTKEREVRKRPKDIYPKTRFCEKIWLARREKAMANK